PARSDPLSLHDALPIYDLHLRDRRRGARERLAERTAAVGDDDGDALADEDPAREQPPRRAGAHHAGHVVVLERERAVVRAARERSEEHTSELQSRENLV